MIPEPILHDEEKQLFERVFRSRWRSYLEFGVGGSTLYAARSGVGSIVAVDSDPVWTRKIGEHPEIEPLVRSGAATILTANVGPVGDWGTPTDNSNVKIWHEYLSLPWAEMARRNTLPQLVYVDGRFRVACCLSAAVACSMKDAADRIPTVLFHGLDETRRHYGVVSDFFESVAYAGSLHVLRWRPGGSATAAFAKLMEYQFDPR